MDYERLIRQLLEDEDSNVKVKDKADIEILGFDKPSDGKLSTTNKKGSSLKSPPGSKNSDARSMNIDPSVADTTRQAYDIFNNNVADEDVEDVPLPLPHTDMIQHVNTDVGVEVRPRNPDNLPDAGRRHAARTDYDEVDNPHQLDLKWYPVRDLPGYQHPKIRGAFTPLFRDELGMRLQDVQVATDIAGSNTKDTRVFAGFLLKNGTIINEWDNLESFGIPREIYNVGRAAVIDYDDQRYFVMIEQHSNGKEYHYIYWGEEQGSDTTTKRIR